MRYPNAKQAYSDALRSIRMPRIAFGYAREEIWIAEAEGIRMPKDGIRMPKAAFECPRGHSDTIKRLLHGGYPDARKRIRMHLRLSRY